MSAESPFAVPGVSESAWDAGWAMFEAWLSEAVKTRPELDDLDLPDRIQVWGDSPEYRAALKDERT